MLKKFIKKSVTIRKKAINMMKKILVILLVSAVSLFALGEEIHNFKYERSYYMAKKHAKEQNKILLIMIFKRGCPNCAYMKDIVFEREKVLNYLNENYVTLLLDAKGHYYPKRFISPRSPTFFFLNPNDETELRPRKVGGSRPEKFLEELTAVKEAYDNNTTLTFDEKPDEDVITSKIKIIN